MNKTGASDSIPPTPGAKQIDAWADERCFHNLVMERLGDDPRRWTEEATQPDPSEWVLIVAAIKNYARRPWTNEDLATLTEGVRRQKRERETLNAAAKILKRDLDQFPDTPAFAELRRAKLEAICQLQIPRGAADEKSDFISRISLQGPAWQNWAYIVRNLAPQIYAILAHHKIVVATEKKSPLTLIMQDVLQFIYGEAFSPDLKAISKQVHSSINEA